MSAASSWGEMANYTTATAPILALIVWLGRVLWNNIRHELTPNSGTSLRDAVDRIENKMHCIESKVDTAIVEIERHKGQHEGLPSATIKGKE